MIVVWSKFPRSLLNAPIPVRQLPGVCFHYSEPRGTFAVRRSPTEVRVGYTLGCVFVQSLYGLVAIAIILRLVLHNDDGHDNRDDNNQDDCV